MLASLIAAVLEPQEVPAMLEKDPIQIFGTHVFAEDENYARVFEYLEQREKFFYQNCRKPDNAPYLVADVPRG